MGRSRVGTGLQWVIWVARGTYGIARGRYGMARSRYGVAGGGYGVAKGRLAIESNAAELKLHISTFTFEKFLKSKSTYVSLISLITRVLYKI